MITTKKVKVAELEGVKLDWAVNRARGLNCGALGVAPDYSKSWARGGPIIEDERIMFHSNYPPGKIYRDGKQPYCALTFGGTCQAGATHLIAAMRAFVASKFGEEVEVPV